MAFPTPQSGSSIILAFSTPVASTSNISTNNNFDTILILSPTHLSSIRTFSALESGYNVIIGSSNQDIWDEELEDRLNKQEIKKIDFNLSLSASQEEWNEWFDELPSSITSNCMMIILNDTVGGSEGRGRRSYNSALAFKQVANSKRYLVNVADSPQLSDFTWPTTHRFNLPPSSSSTSTTTSIKSPLQISINTNSSSCRLASRIKREVIASLPSNIGGAVLAISTLRASLLETTTKSNQAEGTTEGWNESETDEGIESGGITFNKPVEQLNREQSEGLEKVEVIERLSREKIELGNDSERGLSPSRVRTSSCRRGSNAASSISDISSSHSTISTLATSLTLSATSTPIQSNWTALEAQRTRMRYISQISEYWPLERLATVTLASLSAPTTPGTVSPPSSFIPSTSTATSTSPPPSRHSLEILPLTPPQKGRIILLGTGPGSPLLLTRLAHLYLTSPPGSPFHIDLFLSDKLVPSEILALIPEERRKGVIIARKFPGNAENAQDELMRLGVEGAREGKTVLRMKQGDPFLYGRGGEEVLHFREAGFDPLVIPGLSSCLAGPTITGIPVTQRGVAESIVVCTGVGRGGRDVAVDGYDRSRTLTVLMGVARLEALVETLINHPKSSYPPYLPIALIERASSPDQRVVSATISTLVNVLKRLSPHRPPGMIVVGWSVMCLEGTNMKGDMKILDDVEAGEVGDKLRVDNWLGAEGYRVKDGLGEHWRSLVEEIHES